MATVIQLDSALDEAVQELIRGGDFDSPIDVLREAMRLLQRQRLRKALHAKIEAGVAELDAGLGIPIEEVRAELIERYRNWPAKDA
jgi:putative addiction module CopG family antidote